MESTLIIYNSSIKFVPISFLIFIFHGIISSSTNSSSTYKDKWQVQQKQPLSHHSRIEHISSASKRKRGKRSVVHLYDMVYCSTGCNPLLYKGYGCYCGFLGSGLTVDGIDRCCAIHDWCYNHVKCPPLLTYFVPYYWTCSDGQPHCVRDLRGWKGICGADLCECDRRFAECLREYPCPRGRAVCMTSPWRFWQNLLMQPPLHSLDYEILYDPVY